MDAATKAAWDTVTNEDKKKKRIPIAVLKLNAGRLLNKIRQREAIDDANTFAKANKASSSGKKKPKKKK